MKLSPSKIKDSIKQKLNEVKSTANYKAPKPKIYKAKVYTHDEARKAASYASSTTSKIWRIIFCTLPIDIGLVIYIQNRLEPVYKEAPFNLYIYMLLLCAIILPFLFDTVFTVFRTGKFENKDKLMQAVIWIAAAAAIVFVGLSIFEDVNLGRLLGQTAAGLAILSTIYPLLKGFLNVESEELNDRDTKLLIVLGLAPTILLRVAAILIGLQTIFYDQNLTQYLLKWSIVVLLSLIAFPNREWFTNYFEKASSERRTKEASAASRFSDSK